MAEDEDAAAAEAAAIAAAADAEEGGWQRSPRRAAARQAHAAITGSSSDAQKMAAQSTPMDTHGAAAAATPDADAAAGTADDPGQEDDIRAAVAECAYLAVVCDFVQLFGPYFEIEERSSIEDWEQAIVDPDSVPVIDFFCKLLRNFTSREDIIFTNWESILSELLQNHQIEWNPLVENTYAELTINEKARLMNELIDLHLDYNEGFQKHIADIDEDAGCSRTFSIGHDNDNHVYWHLQGQERLYMEEQGETIEDCAWEIKCSSSAEWLAAVEELGSSRAKVDRRLSKTIENDILPSILEDMMAKERAREAAKGRLTQTKRTGRIQLRANEREERKKREYQRKEESRLRRLRQEAKRAEEKAARDALEAEQEYAREMQRRERERQREAERDRLAREQRKKEASERRLKAEREETERKIIAERERIKRLIKRRERTGLDPDPELQAELDSLLLPHEIEEREAKAAKAAARAAAREAAKIKRAAAAVATAPAAPVVVAAASSAAPAAATPKTPKTPAVHQRTRAIVGPRPIPVIKTANPTSKDVPDAAAFMPNADALESVWFTSSMANAAAEAVRKGQFATPIHWYADKEGHHRRKKEMARVRYLANKQGVSDPAAADDSPGSHNATPTASGRSGRRRSSSGSAQRNGNGKSVRGAAAAAATLSSPGLHHHSAQPSPAVPGALPGTRLSPAASAALNHHYYQQHPARSSQAPSQQHLSHYQHAGFRGGDAVTMQQMQQMQHMAQHMAQHNGNGGGAGIAAHHASDAGQLMMVAAAMRERAEQQRRSPQANGGSAAAAAPGHALPMSSSSLSSAPSSSPSLLPPPRSSAPAAAGMPGAQQSLAQDAIRQHMQLSQQHALETQRLQAKVAGLPEAEKQHHLQHLQQQHLQQQTLFQQHQLAQQRIQLQQQQQQQQQHQQQLMFNHSDMPASSAQAPMRE